MGKYRVRQVLAPASELTTWEGVLEEGEWATESDTTLRKVGDGSTPWSGLPYAPSRTRQLYETPATLDALNPILAEGEWGTERGTDRRKVGDGLTAWRDLPYVVPAPDPLDDVPSLVLTFENALL